MATKPNAVRVTAETDLGRLLDEAEREPVLLERDGVVFRLSWETFAYAKEPDPERAERVRAALDASVGSWADLDIDAVIESLYEARRAGTRPPDRP